MSAIGSRAALHAGVEAVTRESGGLVELLVVRPTDIPDLLADVLLGDAEATGIFRMVSDTVTRIETAPKRAPMLCVACPRALRKGYAICVAIPAKDNPRQAIALAVCPRCGDNDRATISAKASEGLKKSWPDLRPVAQTHATGGRA